MDSVYIELAIGLALAFFLLSVLASGVQEGLVRLLGIRAKFLWSYLKDQFDGSSTTESALPATPLGFARLARADPRPRFQNTPASAEGTSDISVTALYERLREIDRSSWTGRTSISQIPASRFAAAVVEIVSSAGDVTAWLNELKAANSPLYRPLESAWTLADGNLDRFSGAVESWFDGEMQRLSTLYRRYSRWIVGIIAVLITAFMGFDAFAFGKALLNDSAFRAEAIAVATGSSENLQDLQQVCAVQQQSSDDIGPAPTPTPTAPPAPSPSPSPNPLTCITDVLGDPALTRVLDNSVVTVDVVAEEPSFQWNWGPWWERVRQPAHWPGFVATAVALLFGAPFWWDVLRRLTGVRSSASVATTSD